MKLVLLPGLDGTGDLFADFASALPADFETTILRYPSDECLSNSELVEVVRSAMPDREPFVLVAESFSTPLAIQIAAANPPNLKALILCAGFAKAPVKGWLRFIRIFLSPLLFRLPVPEFAVRWLLTGPGAPASLISAVEKAVSSVKPQVLSTRLRAVLRCDVRDELSKIAVPILYLKATEDRVVRAPCFEDIRRVNPQVKVIEVSGPHLLLQREAQQTAEIVSKVVQAIGCERNLPAIL